MFETGFIEVKSLPFITVVIGPSFILLTERLERRKNHTHNHTYENS
jgi:hypothetical protein